MPERSHQLRQADKVASSFKGETCSISVPRVRGFLRSQTWAVLWLLLLFTWFAGQAQAHTPVIDSWSVNTGNPAPDDGTWLGKILSIDASTQYVLAAGRGTIRQETHLLASAAPGERFYSLIKKPVNGPGIWSREMIGTVLPAEMTLMPDGGVIVVGHFKGTVLFKTNTTEGLTVTSKGQEDFFVARYLADGSLAWVRAEGGLSPDVAVDVTADGTGTIAVVGTFGGNALVGENFVFSQGMFLALYQSNGTMTWLRTVYGDPSYGTSVSMNNFGHIYASGGFSGAINVEGNLLNSSNVAGSGWHDFLIMRFDLEGRCRWVNQSKSYGHQRISHIAATEQDGVVVAGWAHGFSHIGPFPLSNGTYHHDQGFVAKLDLSGNWSWARAIPSDGYTMITTMDIDAINNIYIGGHFWGSMEVGANTLVSHDYGEYGGGWADAFIMRLGPDGYPAWGVNLGYPDTPSSVNSLEIFAPDQGCYSMGSGGYGFGYGYNYGYGGYGVYGWGGHYINYGHFSTLTRLGSFRPPTALQLITPPGKTAAFFGEPATMRVAVIGSEPTFQWIKDGKDLHGETSSVFRVAFATDKDVGYYSVRIANSLSTITTTPVLLGLYVRPQFVTRPESLMVTTGSNVTLQAQATGTPTPSLRWSKDVNAAGVYHNPTYPLGAVTLDHDGAYTLEAHNNVATNAHHFRIYVDMIPAELGAEVVHDPFREVLYVSTGTNVLRFHLPTKTLLPPIAVGQNLGGLDISPDGRRLVVANRTGTVESNLVYIVDLETETFTETAFQKAPLEGSILDVAFGADGRVLLSSNGWLRSLDPLTGEIILMDRPGSSLMTVSTDRQTMAMVDFNEPNGTIYRYSVGTTNITGSGADGLDSQGMDVGIDRLGRQFVQVNDGKAVFYDQTLQVITTLGSGPLDGPGGVAYHPEQDIVFLSWLGTDEVRAYSTVTFSEVARYRVHNLPLTGGVSFNGAVRLRLNRSGDLLLVLLPEGIRYVRIAQQPPVLLAQPAARTVAGGEPVSFEVMATSSQTLQYQWQKNGEELLNATNRVLQIPLADSSRAGHYRVRVSNTTGTVTSAAALLTVVRGDPQVVWPDPNDIAYGTLLTAVQLNATAITPGNYAYDPPIGTRFPVGNGHLLQVIFTPADAAAFDKATNYALINVLKKSLTVTTSNINRQYGLPNPGLTLNIAGFEPGDSVADLEVLPVVSTTATETSPVGTYPITIAGGSDNNYSFIHGSATLTINQRVVSLSLQHLDQPYNGTPRPITVVASPAGVPLRVTYNGGTTAPIQRGTYTVAVATTDANYIGSANGTLTIFKGSPVVTWNTPVPIVIGTALGGTQLNATAPISGIYAYTPAAGTVLATGQHTLTLIFTPLDSANYLRATNTVTLQVLPLTLANPHLSSTNRNEFRFDFNGVNGVEYLVEISTDLVQWTTLTTFTAQNGSVPVTDPSIFTNEKRFYRIRPKP